MPSLTEAIKPSVQECHSRKLLTSRGRGAYESRRFLFSLLPHEVSEPGEERPQLDLKLKHADGKSEPAEKLSTRKLQVQVACSVIDRFWSTCACLA